MGKQYNKVIKRRRRAAYVAKKKAAIKELVGKSEIIAANSMISSMEAQLIAKNIEITEIKDELKRSY